MFQPGFICDYVVNNSIMNCWVNYKINMFWLFITLDFKQNKIWGCQCTIYMLFSWPGFTMMTLCIYIPVPAFDSRSLIKTNAVFAVTDHTWQKKAHSIFLDCLSDSGTASATQLTAWSTILAISALPGALAGIPQVTISGISSGAVLSKQRAVVSSPGLDSP